MAAREATVRLPKPLAEGALRLRIEVGDAMAPDILDSLSLRVNGHPARLTTATGRPRTFEATLTTAHLDTSPAEVVLQFSVNRTIVPPGDGRTLAVMFRELELTEVEGSATISRSKVPGSSKSD